MRKQKKLFLILLAAAVTGLSACGSSEETSASPQDTTEAAAGAENTKSAETENAQADAAEEKKAEIPAEAEVAESVLWDADGIRITATGLDMKGFLGPELGLLIENNSNADILIQPDYCIVNGYMMDVSLSADVAAGKKANDSLDFSRTSLENCGIETIADIEVVFKIIDPDSYMARTVTSPITVTTSASGTFEQVYDDSGVEVCNADGIRVVARGINDTFMGKGIVFYMENSSGNDYILQAEDVSVNGFMMTPLFSCEVKDGTRAVEDMDFMQSELDNNKIEKVENVEFSLKVLDPATYQTIFASDPVMLTMEGGQ